ncbi:disulfide bond formation protein B [Moraxella bovis]|uniref:Disulfide bond formation protein B n=2 Tax=Moraxella bovis TaxID=476 RepID=A0AAQ2Q3L3_MORBO|nr:disulfide bond formation protein B [Moraxella bovis]UYZ68582.1 disulfide bond formation protein B [Moraxella bovis]UYZ70953.1 disulfide bond formation protein B [Moraxella bovis]UYZ75804.1 disulfide bond formation protein B [Moraxella bovis]UYZ78255.1 disulfide bond formation protein B [Moraxella bovis]UYZ81141.1 disulfide bond formation protein B [Moraxella bovis]
MNTYNNTDSTMLKHLTFRTLCACLFALSVVATFVAIFYFQKHLGLDPCPLCIFQRIGVWIMGVFAFVGMLVNPKKLWAKLTLWGGMALGALWGLGVAGRHVWLQHLPADEVPACGPGLNYWVDTLPILQVFQEVLKGSGECAEIDWQMLGFSIPELTLAMFAVFLVILGVGFARILKKQM